MASVRRAPRSTPATSAITSTSSRCLLWVCDCWKEVTVPQVYTAVELKLRVAHSYWCVYEYLISRNTNQYQNNFFIKFSSMTVFIIHEHLRFVYPTTVFHFTYITCNLPIQTSTNLFCLLIAKYSLPTHIISLSVCCGVFTEHRSCNLVLSRQSPSCSTSPSTSALRSSIVPLPIPTSSSRVVTGS